MQRLYHRDRGTPRPYQGRHQEHEKVLLPGGVRRVLGILEIPNTLLTPYKANWDFILFAV